MLKTKEEIKEFEKEILELDPQIQQYADLHRESYGESVRLKAKRQEAAGRADQEINQLLGNLPGDQSAGGTIDRGYKIKAQHENQHLDDSINKIETTCTLAKHKHDAAAGRKAELENEIHQNEINKHVIETFKKFEKWIESYKVTENHFYNTLLPAISEGYNLDQFFHMRADDLGLSATIKVSLDSHFKRDANPHMHDAVADVARLGDAYGPALLGRSPEPTKVHPMENKGYFDIRESGLPPLQDPKNY